MDIKELCKQLGVEYVEGMTQEDVIKAVNAKRDADQKALKDKDDEIAKQKTLISTRNSEIADLKKKEQEKLSDEEKRQLEHDNLVKELEDLKAKDAVNQKVEAYMAIGYPKDLARKVAEAEVKGEDTTELHKQFITAHDEEVKKQAMAGNPAPKGTQLDPKKYTKEAFKKGEISYEELVELEAKHPDVYKEITSD